ncbi:hypothetical protein V1264_016035 [Littorina saxatilis]|uniref:RING-type domain-containing protein n=2 Tax=Littorina saxatilis TaxID=31220 RepID=A0AAN9GH54_9CAEN
MSCESRTAETGQNRDAAENRENLVRQRNASRPPLNTDPGQPDTSHAVSATECQGKQPSEDQTTRGRDKTENASTGGSGSRGIRGKRNNGFDSDGKVPDVSVNRVRVSDVGQTCGLNAGQCSGDGRGSNGLQLDEKVDSIEDRHDSTAFSRQDKQTNDEREDINDRDKMTNTEQPTGASDLKESVAKALTSKKSTQVAGTMGNTCNNGSGAAGIREGTHGIEQGAHSVKTSSRKIKGPTTLSSTTSRPAHLTYDDDSNEESQHCHRTTDQRFAGRVLREHGGIAANMNLPESDLVHEPPAFINRSYQPNEALNRDGRNEEPQGFCQQTKHEWMHEEEDKRNIPPRNINEPCYQQRFFPPDEAYGKNSNHTQQEGHHESATQEAVVVQVPTQLQTHQRHAEDVAELPLSVQCEDSYAGCLPETNNDHDIEVFSRQNYTRLQQRAPAATLTFRREQVCLVDQDTNESGLLSVFADLEAENERLMGRFSCLLCRENEFDVVLMPCEHVLCFRCSFGIDLCTICSRQITGKYRVQFSL